VKSSRVPSRPRKESTPNAVQVALRARLERHVRAHWMDRCREVVVRFRGAFAYIDAFPLQRQFMLGTTPEEQARIEATPTHLCRLGYLGRADLWSFAFFKYSNEKYEKSFHPSGDLVGTPEEAFDCAAQVYLQDCGEGFMGRPKSDSNLRIPEAVRREAEEIIRLTDGFCTEHLDGEYGGFCRKLVGELARKRPSPLLRGDLRIWAGAVIYTIGIVNFLFDRTQRPHLTADQLSQRLGLSKSTLAAKAKRIQDLLNILPFEPRYCRQALLADNPLVWMISVNGFLVDARKMPPEIQEEARRRGLIPDLPLPTTDTQVR
jgi:hypothetical protein